MSNSPYYKFQTDQYENHDRAIVDEFTCFRDMITKDFLTGVEENDVTKPVPIFFGTPQRAFGINSKWYHKLGYRVLPLPMITIFRLQDDVNDPERFRYGPLRKVEYLNNSRQVAQTDYPQPILFNYQIDVWTNTQKEMNLIKQAFRRSFPADNFKYISVNLGKPLGNVRSKLEFSGWSGSVAEELQGSDVRIIRCTTSPSLYGWFQYNPTIVPTVLKHDISVIEEETEKLLTNYTYVYVDGEDDE